MPALRAGILVQNPLYFLGWKGAIFLGVEIASLAYRSHYNKKGDNFVSKYKNFADEHWSFDKWIKDATTFSDEDHDIYDAMIYFHC